MTTRRQRAIQDRSLVEKQVNFFVVLVIYFKHVF
jgi:hypothetical protein